MKSLDSIARECDALARSLDARAASSFGTDKSSHGFADFYESLVGHLRDEPITILEVGVRTGGSIKMWELAFPRAKVVGVDHNIKLCKVSTKAVLIEADARSHASMTDICLGHGPFDVVIDDAAHTPECSFSIMSMCFPASVKPGGWYFVEDTHVPGMDKVVSYVMEAVNHHGALRSCGRKNWVEARPFFDTEIERVVARPGIIAMQRYKP